MDEQLTFEFEQRPTIKGFPELRWTGKRQPKEDQYPAQMKLRYEKQLRKEETVNGICSGPEGS